MQRPALGVNKHSCTTGGMQACKSTTYTHTGKKNTNSRVDFRFLRMNCCKMPSLLSGTSHRAAAFQFVALCFSHDFLTKNCCRIMHKLSMQNFTVKKRTLCLPH